LNTLNKVAIPLYFRGCPQNILDIKPDYSFIYLALVVVVVQIIILFLQTILGPRFFMPCKKEVGHRFYYTIEELIALKPDFSKVSI
jgi:hypothetical protein